MNIFESLRSYAGKWQVKSSRNFSEEEIACVAHAEVVESLYGTSACFHMTSGNLKYIPMDQNTTLTVGDSIDLTKAKLLTLTREGSNPITRVSI